MKMKKIVATGSALALTAAVAVGATLAYLQDQTNSITNTFVIGDGVALDLTETKGLDKGDGTREFTLVPGTPVAKDPKVQVTLADGGPFYVFVKVEEGADVDEYYTYAIDDAWTALGDSYPGVYYRSGVMTPDEAAVSVLAGDVINVKDTVETIAEDADIDLTFTAYAIQQAGFDDAADAWGEFSGLNA